jgi:hypothetical protein
MLEAQIDTLPIGVPARNLLLHLRHSHHDTWASTVSKLRMRLGNLPNIHTWLNLEEEVDLSAPPYSRKSLLLKFKATVVAPAVHSYDDYSFKQSVQSLPWPYAKFQKALSSMPDQWLAANWSQSQWKDLQIWSLVRATGRWAFPPLEHHVLPLILDKCPLCDLDSVHVVHLFASCPGTAMYRAELHNAPTGTDEMCNYLFGERTISCDRHVLDPKVSFVAKAIRLALASQQSVVDPLPPQD